MLETVRSDWKGKILTVLLLFLAGWWLLLQFPATKTDTLNSTFGAVYGIVALVGAVWGLQVSRKWGGLKSIMGKALTLFALGLLAQEFGQLSYFYYVFILHIDVPYPSIGDIGYFSSIFFYAFGVIYLAGASGVKIGLRSTLSKLWAVIIPLIILLGAYNFFLRSYTVDWSNPLKVFLDFGYPLGQAVYVALALLTYLLSRNSLGGIMKNKILFILFALFVQFLSDYTFLYQSNNGIWQAGGINDFMYLVAYFLMALALLQVGGVWTKLSGNEYEAELASTKS